VHEYASSFTWSSFIDFKQLLTTLLVGLITFLGGLYLIIRNLPLVTRRRLITWSKLFDEPINLGPPGGPNMWEITRGEAPITEGSLVILDIECSGTDIPEPEDWINPLSFRFPGRQVIHFKVRDSDDIRDLVQPGPEALQGPTIELPKIRLNHKDRFKLLVLLTGSGEGVSTTGRLQGGQIKERGLRSRQTRNIAAFATVVAVLALVLTTWILPDNQHPRCTSLAGDLTLSGSTAFAPIATVVSHEYQDYCKNTSFTISAVDSNEGVADLKKSLKKDPRPDEIAMSDGLQDTDPKLTSYPVGVVFYAVVANREGAPSALDRDELRRVFSDPPSPGIFNASPSDPPIVAVGRPKGSGTRTTFEKKVLGLNPPEFPEKNEKSGECQTPQERKAALERKEASPDACIKDTTIDLLTYVNETPGAIGYAESDALAFFPNVKKVAIKDMLPTRDDILPTRDATLKGLYPFAATEYLYTATNPPDRVNYYINFLTSHAMTVRLRGYDFIGCADFSSRECPQE